MQYPTESLATEMDVLENDSDDFLSSSAKVKNVLKVKYRCPCIRPWRPIGL
jgi:hypothetical protein